MAEAGNDNIWVGDLPATLLQTDLQTIFEQYGTVTNMKLIQPKSGGTKACAMVRYESADMAAWVVENLNGNIPQGLDEPIVCRFANAPVSKEEHQAKLAKASGKGCWSKGWQADAWQAPGKGYGKAWGADSWGGAGAQPYGGMGGMAAMAGKSKGKGKSAKGVPQSIHHVYAACKKGELYGSGKVPEECTLYVKNLPPDTSDLDLYKIFAPFGAIAPTGVRAMLNDDGSCKGIGFVDFVDPASTAMVVMTMGTFQLPDGTSIQVAQKNSGKGAQ